MTRCIAAEVGPGNGQSGPSLPSSDAPRPGLCKGRYLRTADLSAQRSIVARRLVKS